MLVGAQQHARARKIWGWWAERENEVVNLSLDDASNIGARRVNNWCEVSSYGLAWVFVCNVY